MNLYDDDPEELMARGMMPNSPRDPEQEAMRAKKMRAYLQPRMEADPGPERELRRGNQDMNFMNILLDSANQVGTVGGKSASNKPFQDFSGRAMAQNQGLIEEGRQERKEGIADQDRQLKLAQYFEKQGLANEDRAYSRERDKIKDKQHSETIAASKESKAAETGRKTSDQLINLSTKYGDEENVKRLNNYRDSLANAEALAKNPTPANDTSMLYQYVKANDPNTGVKDMELQIASRSGPVWDKIQGFMEGMESGMMLPKKRQQLLDNIRAQSNAAEGRVRETEGTYEGLATKAGLDPNDVIGNRRNRYKEPKQETKRQYSPSRNKTKIIYSDGTEEIIDGKG
jgi:hypothetical protein